MLVALPLGCLLMAALVAFFLACAGGMWAVWTMIALSGAAFIWAWAMMTTATGWDGLGYVVGAFLMALPALLGCALGGGLGHWRRRRHCGGCDDDLA